MNGTETLICGGNETLFTKIFSNMIAAGSFPQNNDEAMVTENAKDMLNLSIGDHITVDMPNGAEHEFRISGFVKNTCQSYEQRFLRSIYHDREISFSFD